MARYVPLWFSLLRLRIICTMTPIVSIRSVKARLPNPKMIPIFPQGMSPWREGAYVCVVVGIVEGSFCCVVFWARVNATPTRANHNRQSTIRIMIICFRLVIITMRSRALMRLVLTRMINQEDGVIRHAYKRTAVMERYFYVAQTRYTKKIY